MVIGLRRRQRSVVAVETGRGRRQDVVEVEHVANVDFLSGVSHRVQMTDDGVERVIIRSASLNIVQSLLLSKNTQTKH